MTIEAWQKAVLDIVFPMAIAIALLIVIKRFGPLKCFAVGTVLAVIIGFISLLDVNARLCGAGRPLSVPDLRDGVCTPPWSYAAIVFLETVAVSLAARLRRAKTATVIVVMLLCYILLFFTAYPSTLNN